MVEGLGRREVLRSVGGGTVSTFGSGPFNAVRAKGRTVRRGFHTGGNIDTLGSAVADGTVSVGSDDENLYAVDAGISGLSKGSRVMLGTLDSHGEPHPGEPYQGQVDTPAETPTQPTTETATETPECSDITERAGSNDDSNTPVGEDDDGGGIAVLNRFGDLESSLGLGRLGLNGGTGGYALYQRTNDDKGRLCSSRRGQQSQQSRGRPLQLSSNQQPQNDRSPRESPDRSSPDETQSWSPQDDQPESNFGRGQGEGRDQE